MFNFSEEIINKCVESRMNPNKKYGPKRIAKLKEEIANGNQNFMVRFSCNNGEKQYDQWGNLIEKYSFVSSIDKLEELLRSFPRTYRWDTATASILIRDPRTGKTEWYDCGSIEH